MTEENKKYELSDLPKVGPTTLVKLHGAGVFEVSSLAVMSPGELSGITGMGKGVAMEAIKAAIDMCDIGFTSAFEFKKVRDDTLFYIPTGSKEFDNLIGGKGLESKSVIQAYGKNGCSKSQLGFTLAVNAVKMGGKCIFVDTENTFKPERIMEIAKNVGLNPEDTLKNIQCAQAQNVDMQILFLDKIEETVRADSSYKLIVIDSLMNHFRAEGGARGQLADRQKLLNVYLHKLQNIAMANNLVVYYTNQVMDNPAAMFGDGMKRIGGNILNHHANFILELKKPSAQIGKCDRIVKLVKSPVYPDGEALYYIGAQGVCDDIKDINLYEEPVETEPEVFVEENPIMIEKCDTEDLE